MTRRPLIIAAALAVAGVAATACEPKPVLPPLVQDGACIHTTDRTNRARCVIYTTTRKPGYWVQGPAWDAYFQVSYGTAKIVKDPS
jgi:hypothetical protein